MADKANAPHEENNRTVSENEGAGTRANASVPQVLPKVCRSYGHYSGILIRLEAQSILLSCQVATRQ